MVKKKKDNNVLNDDNLKERKKKRTVKDSESAVKNDDLNLKIDSKKSSKVNEKESDKSYFKLSEVIIIMLVVAVFGILIGITCSYYSFSSRGNKNNIINDDMDEFVSIYNGLLNDYYNKDNIDKNSLITSAIKGMVSSLDDPYAEYIDGYSSSIYNEGLKGSYLGLGMSLVLMDDGYYTVVEVFENSEAFKKGILTNDKIVMVNGVRLDTTNFVDFESIIKNGQKGDIVKLSIMRDGNIMEMDIARDYVEVPSVSSYSTSYKGKMIGVISISKFAANTYKQFEKEYEKLKSSNIEYLVIDLRNNNGGYLSSAREIASLFLNKNDVIYQKNVNGKKEKYVSENDRVIDIPISLVVNGGTASSAEVFVSALSYNLKAKVVGIKTFGKGTIQNLISLSDGSYIKYTVQKWLTPDGTSIDGVGIVPDFIVDEAPDFSSNTSLDNDLQVKRAIDELIK